MSSAAGADRTIWVSGRLFIKAGPRAQRRRPASPREGIDTKTGGAAVQRERERGREEEWPSPQRSADTAGVFLGFAAERV